MLVATEVVVAVQHAVLIASCCILRLITRNRIHVGVLCVLFYWQSKMVHLLHLLHLHSFSYAVCKLHRVPVSVVRDIILTFLHAVISPLLHPVQASTLNFISTPHLSAEVTADNTVV